MPDSVTITGILDGKPWSRELSVKNVTEQADYLPRTWAKLEIDRLPAIDQDFRSVLQGTGASEPWSQLMNKTAGKLIEDKHRPAILALARQCWQLDDQPLAQHLLTLADE